MPLTPLMATGIKDIECFYTARFFKDIYEFSQWPTFIITPVFDTPTNDVKLFIEILDTVQSSINRQINLQKVIEGSRYKMTGKLRTK